jgi:mannose-1-phosphate guanylyltransferase / phosphomannomutase
MIAAILAGGKGTRLGEKARGLPKPMVEVAGKPLLLHQIEFLKRQGITTVVLLVGYKAEVIKNYFRDGSSFGVSIFYSEETEPLGTAGAIKKASALLPEPFVLLYGDVMADMDIARMIAFHHAKGGMVTLAVHPNSHPYDSDLVEVGDEGNVTGFFPKPHEQGVNYQNCVNAGVYVCSPEIMRFLPDHFSDFGKDIFPRLLRERRPMFGYVTSEYIKDMGTPQRLESVETDFLSGKTSLRNLSNKQLAVFLDRDGVINHEVNLVCRAEDITLLPRVTEAIRALNASLFLCIVVTNQPVVARGLCDLLEIKKMHNRIDTLLGESGAYIDRYYFCPHHPDKGFAGENPLYKIACSCRKPKTGMIDAATEKFNIDPRRSYIIGDSTRDIQTGKNARLSTILVATGYGGSDGKFSVKPDFSVADLLEATQTILHPPEKIR